MMGMDDSANDGAVCRAVHATGDDAASPSLSRMSTPLAQQMPGKFEACGFPPSLPQAVSSSAGSVKGTPSIASTSPRWGGAEVDVSDVVREADERQTVRGCPGPCPLARNSLWPDCGHCHLYCIPRPTFEACGQTRIASLVVRGYDDTLEMQDEGDEANGAEAAANFESKAAQIKRDMELSLKRVRELKTNLRAGAETLEAVSSKLSKQISLCADDSVLQRITNARTPEELAAVDAFPGTLEGTHDEQEKMAEYLANLARRVSGSEPVLDLNRGRQEHSAFSPNGYSGILSHLLRWLDARLRHKRASRNLYSWAFHVRLVKKYARCVGNANNRRDLSSMALTFDTLCANLANKHKDSDNAPPLGGEQDNGLEFKVVKAENVKACRATLLPPPPLTTESSVVDGLLRPSLTVSSFPHAAAQSAPAVAEDTSAVALETSPAPKDASPPERAKKTVVWGCEFWCGFKGAFEEVSKHEASCKLRHTAGKRGAVDAYSPSELDKVQWTCQFKCGHSAKFTDVELHEKGCVNNPIRAQPDATLHAMSENSSASWGCEFACGYTGTFDDVQDHEKSCSLSAMNSPALHASVVPQTLDGNDGVNIPTDTVEEMPVSPPASLKYSCEWDCGFTGQYDQVSTHELTCVVRLSCESTGRPTGDINEKEAPFSRGEQSSEVSTSTMSCAPEFPIEMSMLNNENGFQRSLQRDGQVSSDNNFVNLPYAKPTGTASDDTHTVDLETDASVAATEPRHLAPQGAKRGAADANHTLIGETWPRQSLWNSKSSALLSPPASPFLDPAFSPVLAMCPGSGSVFFPRAAVNRSVAT